MLRFNFDLMLFNFIVINLVFVLVEGVFSADTASVVESSQCRRARIVDYRDGYSCDIIVTDPTDGTVLHPDTYNAVPRNASAVRLTYRRPTTTSRPKLVDELLPVVPSLPALRILEVDVGAEKWLGGGMFVNLASVEQLYVFRASLSDSENENDFSLGLPSPSSTSSTTSSSMSTPPTFAGLTSLSTLVLSDLGLASVPDDAFVGLRSLRTLYLNNNQLARLHTPKVAVGSSSGSGSLFRDCSHVTSLSLARNRLSSLGDVSFAGLVRLRSLDLYGNEIEHLDVDDVRASSLVELDEIVEINLSGNRLATIRSGTFHDGPRSLRTLYVDSNRLADVEPGAFDRLDSLASLDLSGNRISVIRRGAFRGLQSLATLTMKSNGLTMIDNQVWQGLSQLNYLDLSSNRLSQIDDDTFDGLAGVENVDLSDNLLRVVGQSSFSRLINLSYLNLAGNRLRTVGGLFQLPVPTSVPTAGFILDLSGNAWQCDDCGVRRLANWLRDALTGNDVTVAQGIGTSFKLRLDNVEQTRCSSDGPLLMSALPVDPIECQSPKPEVTSTSFVTTANDSVTVGTVAVAGSVAAMVRSTLPVIDVTTDVVTTTTTTTMPTTMFFHSVVIVTAMCLASFVVLALIVAGVTWCCCALRRCRRRRRRRNADLHHHQQHHNRSRRPTWCSTSTNDDDLEADAGNSSVSATLSRSSQRLHGSLGALVNSPTGSYSPHRAEKYRHYHHVHHQYYNDHVTEAPIAGTYTMRPPSVYGT